MKLDFVSYNSVELYRIYSLHYFFNEIYNYEMKN